MDAGADDVGDDEEEHADLPSSAAVRGSVEGRGNIRTSVFEQVRFSLEGEAEGLDAGGEETDKNANLATLV